MPPSPCSRASPTRSSNSGAAATTPRGISLLTSNTENTEGQIALPDGRRLGYGRYGDPGGAPVFYFHGFPASRLEGAIIGAAAGRVGASIIAPDRPGFGRSDFQPGRRILDWPGDVRRLADALGLDDFAVLGVSGGGPYAAACAHRLGPRLIRAASAAGLGPTTDAELVRGMGAIARLGFHLARRHPGVFGLAYGTLAGLVARYPDLVFRLNQVTPPDQAVLATPEVRSILVGSMREALRPGVAGAVHEFKLLASPWGFGLEDIAAPFHVWHGCQDGTVPHAMAQSMAARMPNAHLHLLDDEGHISLAVHHGAEIIAALLAPS